MKPIFPHKLFKLFGLYNDKNYRLIAKPSDQIIVEFPKSGVTYLSVLLSNLYCEENTEINYFNVNMYVQDLHFKFRHTSLSLAPNLSLKKSHYEYTKDYRNIIHLFRNPIDVMVSYFNYFNSFSTNNVGTFSDFIRSRRGVQRWKSHSISYIKADLTVRYFPLSYERAVKDAAEVCKVHSRLVGVSIDDEAISRALKLSSKNYMVNFEKHYLAGGRAKDKELFTGEKRFTRNDVNENDIQYILNECLLVYNQLKHREKTFFDAMNKII